MNCLPRLVHIGKTIPITIPTEFFIKHNELHQEIIRKSKERESKIFLKRFGVKKKKKERKKHKVGGLIYQKSRECKRIIITQNSIYIE